MNKHTLNQQFSLQHPAHPPNHGGGAYQHSQPFHPQQQYQYQAQQRPPQAGRPPSGGQPGAYRAAPPPKRPAGKRGRKWPFILIAIVLLAGGAFFGIQALRDRQVAALIAPYEEVYAPNIIINGVSIAGLKPQEAKDRLISDMQQKVNSWSMNLKYGNHVFATINYESLGLRVDDNQLYALLNEAWLLTHTGDIHARKAAIEQLQTTPFDKQVLQNELSDQQLDGMLNQIAPYINKDPVNAAIMHFQPDNDNEPFLYQHEQVGYRFDVASTKAQIMARASAGQSGDFELAGEPIQPDVTVAQLKEKTALRSSIATDISSSSEVGRNNNIMVSLSRFNGMILKPGESFSFNKVVGPRTLKAGFFDAPELVYGDLVTGVGGGVCQSSTTLYQAAITAGLTITKRDTHSEKVSYCDLGQDATVYMHQGREIDFAFKNTTPDNIYLAARVRPAKRNSKRLVTEIKIYGLSLGEGISYRMRSETVQILPPPVDKKYEVDKTGLIATYKNEEKLKTKAKEGYVVETYLEKLLNGQVIESKFVSKDTYPSKPAVYYRGNVTPPSP